ncbi:MAG: acyl-CoA dehydrogenase family protein [Candidatus Eremiobacteraeota bacterium]|nr:acyl-CoA dehydrogenase family protein [Candidatus Eremiobacteraeota bacterium]
MPASEEERPPFREQDALFRRVVRRFVETEIVPHHAQWEEEGCVPRSLWRKAGEAGLLCTTIPEAYGGAGDDIRSAVVALEEQARAGVTGPSFSLHSNIVAPYLLHYGSDGIKRTWLPRFVDGSAIGAIAMTEPRAGSDLAGIETRAVRDGAGYRITGNKTFVSNGQLADAIVVVAKTDAARGAHGISLFLVDAAAAGFARGKNLDKIGMHAQDTSELFLDGVFVEESALLGELGRGFEYLMAELPQERFMIAVAAVAAAEGCFAQTLAYVGERSAFGKRVADFQHTRFVLADAATEIELGRTFIDACVVRHLAGNLTAERAAMAKVWCTEMEGRVVDACLQLHGGYGYMREYPVARAYVDARVKRIYGGSNEIMREVIGRGLLSRRGGNGG